MIKINSMNKFRLWTLVLLILSPLLIFASDLSQNLIYYQEKMVDEYSNPITATLVFRFSIWTSSDYQASDLTSTWAINSANPKFTGYQEIQTITPDAFGVYFAKIWIVNPLPILNPEIHRYIQAEIKRVWTGDTAFQPVITDYANGINRVAIDSALYSMNSIKNYFDQKIWTDSGQIALLSWSWKFSADKINNFTNETSYTINQSDSTSDISLIFGKTLNKFIKWAWWSAQRFEMNDNLFVSGFINAASGATINGKDVNTYLTKIDNLSGSNIAITASWGLISTNVQDALVELNWNILNKNAWSIPFIATWGLSSTNVQSAIQEVSTRSSRTETLNWDYLYWTTSWKYRGFVMTWTWKIISISLATDPTDYRSEWDFVISKNDNWNYSNSNKMTGISLYSLWNWDSKNSAYSINPTPGSATLDFKPWDILRAYHVWSSHDESNLTIRVQYE